MDQILSPGALLFNSDPDTQIGLTPPFRPRQLLCFPESILVEGNCLYVTQSGKQGSSPIGSFKKVHRQVHGEFPASQLFDQKPATIKISTPRNFIHRCSQCRVKLIVDVTQNPKGVTEIPEREVTGCGDHMLAKRLGKPCCAEQPPISTITVVGQ